MLETLATLYHGSQAMSIGQGWQRGDGPPFLDTGCVHIWRLRADGPGADVRRACRALLHELLGRYTGVPADRVELTRGPFGKPELPGGAILFNVSHSGCVGLVALAASGRVGVDVEMIRSDVDVDRLARSFFTEPERESIHDLATFYTCWTRKEAMIKARGGSICQPSAAPGDWQVRDLPMEDGYAASLCTEGAPERVYFWERAWRA